ncbi:hypothetical protein MmiHf6_03240 [Methanimicrococcus hongohii]|uniref:DUF7847 domain-containing protein n=1 Tax=Methanimicrococcus hongohii TaxID=3028295 RepID=A0AA96V116_9EURY|nr:hypothetical protein [Methanimicrococcus sp. Hf6]WNY23028.1 hypothetical protein MmiHf6_03240 [Methanimicrococcus sp. Hf6]
MENIGDTFTKGWKNLSRNPILFAPVVILALISFVLAIVWSVSFVVFLEAGNLLYIGASFLIFLIAVILLSCYLTAGWIGMAKEAIAFGSTNFSDMFKYGNKFAIRMLLSTILMIILELVAVIFWIPLIYVYLNSGYTLEGIVDSMVNNPDAFLSIILSFAVPLLIGFLLTFIYSVILTVLFYFVSYAIVVDDISVIGAYKKSYAVLKQNFWNVLVFIILIWAITVVVTTVFQVLSIVGVLSFWLTLIISIVQMIVTLFLSVAVTVWTTRFYMSATDHPLYEEEKLTDY